MKNGVFIFVGKSGCGKGTQADLLREYFKKTYPKNEFFSLETGEKFRELAKKTNYTSELAKKINDTGGLQPEFLCVSFWGALFIEKMKPDTALFIDGSPRKLYEAYVLDGALEFYERKNIFVIFLDSSADEVTARLLKRGRVDDTPSGIAQRLRWFETDVVPSINFFKENPRYRFLNINGQQPIEKVHADIVREISALV